VLVPSLATPPAGTPLTLAPPSLDIFLSSLLLLLLLSPLLLPCL
jgi:hypothetical protein